MTTKIVRILYALGMIISILYGLAILIAFLAEGGGLVVVGLIGGPIAAFLGVLMTRIWCEIIIIVFRLTEHAAEIAQNTRR